MADQIVSRNGGAPVTMGPAGLWLDADGQVAATDMQGNPQETPGEANTVGGTIYHDDTKNLDYTVGPNGQKSYIAPSAMGGPSTQPGGSFLTNRGTWNPSTGSYDQGTNWGNVLSLVVAGTLTAGAASAIMSGASVAEAGVSADIAPDVSSAVAADTAAGATPLAPADASAAVAAAAPGGAAAAPTLGIPTAAALPGGVAASPLTGIATAAEAPTGMGAALSTQGATVTGDTLGGALPTGAAAAGPNTMQNVLGAAGQAVGNAAKASAQNSANQTSQQNSAVDSWLEIAQEEDAQRQADLKNMAFASYVNSGSHSPFDPTPPTPSAAEKSTLTALQQQAMNRLSTAPTFGTNAILPYTPGQPGTLGVQPNPSTLQQIGGYASPILSIASKVPASTYATIGSDIAGAF